jgi:putative ABC transport system ATP-binding protein
MSVVSLKNLSKTFSQGEAAVKVFSELNLDVAAGETLAIVGPSGSGKSTLLSLIAGLDSPSQGDVVVLGKNLAVMSEKELAGLRRENIGIIFQQFNLFSHLSALENVALPLELADDKQALKKAEAALGKVGLSHRLTHFPHQLSGGENQRVAIARALVVEPKLLLADEPSGSLDQKTGDQVMELLFQLVRDSGTTLVLVTHNNDLALQCKKQFNFKSVMHG